MNGDRWSPEAVAERREALAIKRAARIACPPLKALVRFVERGKRQTRHNQIQTAVWYENDNNDGGAA